MKNRPLTPAVRAAIRRPPGRSQLRGFSLIEVMVALLVFSVGALALGRLGAELLRQGEAARHRTEATLLAQAQLDALRAEHTGLTDLAQEATGLFSAATARPAAGSDVPAAASNTRFERRWQLQGAPSDPERRIDVDVRWNDRDGRPDPAGVRLSAWVAHQDRADAGRLALRAQDDDDRHRPQGRSLAVPTDARSLAGANRGRSVWRWHGASTGFLVFNDSTGRITHQCAAAPDDTTDVESRCQPLDGLLLSGHLSGPGVGRAVDVAIVQAQHLLATPECHVDRPAAPALVRGYHCLLRPGDHDANASTPRVWSGRAIVLPEPTGTQAVCRYSPAPSTTPSRNEDHPAVYALVSRALHGQNFALIDQGPCPDGSESHQPG